LLVAETNGAAGACFNPNIVSEYGKFVHARWGHADSIFVIFAFFWHADLHYRVRRNCVVGIVLDLT
jgi:hypothetical protein